MPGVRFGAWQRSLARETPPLVWAAFFLLCGMIASSWLLPSPPSGGAIAAQQQAATFAVGGLLGLVAGGRLGVPPGRLWRLGVAGVLLFGLPFLLLDQARMVNDVTRVALFAAAPIPIVMGVALGQTGTLQGGRYLSAAVLGFGGMLFVLPVELPVDLHGALSLAPLVGAVASVAGASVWLPKLLQNVSFRSAMVAVCLANALLLFVSAGLSGRLTLPELSVSALWSGAATLLQLGLLLWLLRAMLPERLAARFLVVPLLTTVEGYVLLHGAPTVRVVSGVLVAAGCAAYLLLGNPAEDTSALSLR